MWGRRWYMLEKGLGWFLLYNRERVIEWKIIFSWRGIRESLMWEKLLSWVLRMRKMWICSNGEKFILVFE